MIYFETDFEYGQIAIAFIVTLAISLVLSVPFIAAACQIVTQASASTKACIVWACGVHFRSYVTANVFAAAAIVLGFLAFIAPGFYASVILGFVVPVALLERTAPLATLDRSIDLVRGAFWRTAGAIIGLGLGAIVAAEFVIAYFAVASSGTGHFMDSLAAAVVRSLAASVTYAVVFIAYIQRRAERDGLDASGLRRAYAAAGGPVPVDRT
jgi:hypothetical protein